MLFFSVCVYLCLWVQSTLYWFREIEFYAPWTNFVWFFPSVQSVNHLRFEPIISTNQTNTVRVIFCYFISCLTRSIAKPFHGYSVSPFHRYSIRDITANRFSHIKKRLIPAWPWRFSTVLTLLINKRFTNYLIFYLLPRSR